MTAVIGPDGTIKKFYPKVNAKTHMDDVLRDLGGTPPVGGGTGGGGGFLKRLFGR